MNNCPPNSKENRYLNPQIGPLTTPFKHIALAMSGGGSRACAFSLGVLSYLKQVPYDKNHSLLEQVTYLSSASGGTITTSTYSFAIANQIQFGEFYKTLSEQMTGTTLVDLAMNILNDKKAWTKRPAKERNIINAFSLAYDQLLFNKNTVHSLKNNSNAHLDEVCFNTTEFRNGLLFRQSVKLKEDSNPLDKPYFLFGNYKLHLDHQVAENLHLSDLLAASSCFPGGFEPMVFPDDFSDLKTSKQELLNGLCLEIEEINWPELEGIYGKKVARNVYDSMEKPVNVPDFLEKLNENQIKNDFSFCLMDGGITDNQGVESLVQANKRRAAETTDFKQFDLMMICDVDSKWMEPYELPSKSSTAQWFTIRKLLIGAWVGLFLFTGLSGLLCCKFITLCWWWQPILFTVSVISSLLCAKLLLIIYKAKRYVVKESHGKGIGLDKIFNRQIRERIFEFFGNVPFSKLIFMLKVRITSLIQISSDIFMARIRYLLYDQFFNQDGLKQTGRAKSNHIYDLSFTNDKDRKEQYNTKYNPSTDMQVVAEYAKNMATTLWFSKDGRNRKMQAAITACGQFTTCYNLLDYIEKMRCNYGRELSIYESLSLAERNVVDDIEHVLMEHFDRFCEDPFWLYNRLGTVYEIDDFHPVSSNIYSFPKEFAGLR